MPNTTPIGADALREALKWAAAALQAIAPDEDTVRDNATGETRSVGQILDAADAALASAAPLPAVQQVEPIGYLAAYEIDRLKQGHDGRLRSFKFGPSPLDSDVPVYLGPLPTAGVLADAAQPVAVPHAQMTEEIDLHRLQHIESAALLALGLLWMTERDNDKVQAAFKTLRDALGSKNALRQGIEAAIDAGYEADHPPGADWWAGKKDES